MTIAQYYNQARRRMEVPIIVSGGVDTINYISYCSLNNTTLVETFAGLPPVIYDKVRRYDASLGVYRSSTYTGSGWWLPGNVEPIEAGVGYQYVRKVAGGSTTWIYDCVFVPSATRSQLCKPLGTKGVLQQ